MRRPDERWSDYFFSWYMELVPLAVLAVGVLCGIAVFLVMPILILLGVDVQIGCSGDC